METNQEITQVTTPPKSKKLMAIIVCISIIVCGALWYFLYYVKTPGYTLNIIRESIEKHDIAKFNKHVDLDSTLSRGYDDLMAAMLESDKSIQQEEKAFIGGFIQIFKTPIVSALKDGITRFVETGKWDDKQTNEKDAQQKINPDKIADNSGLKNSSFKGIAYTKKDGKTATVGLNIFEKDTNKDYVLDIKMRELDDGTWQVAEISNLKEYFTAIEKEKVALTKKYLEATKPIVDLHNKNLDEMVKRIDTIEKTPSMSMETKTIEIIKIMENEIIPDWNKRAEEINKVTVPASAKEIHQLRLKVIELQLLKLNKYIAYLSTKNLQVNAEINDLNKQVRDVNQQVLNLIAKAQQ
ncbi:hypothetical protein [Sporomusa paucivorans]|uniref:hypothetical protein n=1 Tax=Sporomusa paucivorans TaxID=2376 RepID=UPI0035710953